MNTRRTVHVIFAFAVIAPGILFSRVAHAQNLFVSNFNSEDKYPFDGQHPIQQYDAATGAYEGNIAFNGRPTGMTTAPDGSLYVSNFTDIPPDGNGYRPPDTIEHYDANGNFLQSVAIGVADPYGLTLDQNGNVYVAAKYYTANGTQAGTGTVLEYTKSGTLIPLATVFDPYDVVFDASGNLYVTSHQYYTGQYDGYGNRINGAVLKYDPNAQTFNFFAAVPEPTGLAFRDGVLYAASNNYNDVWTFDTDGTKRNELAAPANRKAGGPNGLAFDAAGNLYTATQTGDVRRYDSSTDSFQVFAGTSGPPLKYPFGLAFTNLNSPAAAPEPPGVAALGFTGLILGCGLLKARRRASQSADGPGGDSDA